MLDLEENNLENLYSSFCTLNWVEKTNLLTYITKSINKQNAKLVLSFLLEISTNLEIRVPFFTFQTMEKQLNEIKELLNNYLPDDCLFLLENIKDFNFQELAEENKKVDMYDYLNKIIFDSLITFSTKEIEHFINIYFEPSDFTNQTDVFEYFMNKIDQSKFIGMKEREFIFKSIRNEEIENLLTCLEKSKMKDEIVYSIYYFNPTFYEILVKFVVNLQISSLYDSLPKINENLLLLKDLDTNLLLKILLERPLLFDKTINLFINENFEEHKEDLIKIISENFDLLEKKVDLFPLSFSDNLKIAEKNIKYLNKIIENLEKYENVNVTELNSILVKLSSEDMIESFKLILKKDTEIRRKTVKTFVENTPLTQDLKEFFLNNLNDTYFYSMLPYYKKEKQLESLSKYLIDKESLNYFLKVFSLGELFYFSHYITDITRAKNAIQLCIDHPQFSVNTILFAIPKMESNKLPCLIMRSIIISYLKIKEKSVFVSILNIIIRKNFWKDKGLVQGFVKMLELLSSDSIEVLKNIESDTLYPFLRANPNILKLCRDYFDKNEPSDHQSTLLRNIVFSNKI